MATKKEIQDEELNKVSGGVAAVQPDEFYDRNKTCPNCKSTNVTSETNGKGCDQKTTYKCQDCGHTW